MVMMSVPVVVIQDTPVLGKLEAHPVVVDLARGKDEREREEGLGEDVEDAVEDGFRVVGDLVAGFGDAPADWVEEPFFGILLAL